MSDIKYDGSSTIPTDAGTYAVTADFVPTDTTNFNNLSDVSAGDFVIEKADTVTDVICPASEQYTSFAIEPCTVSVTGPGLNLSPDPTYSDNVNVGTATAEYDYAGDTNYEPSDDSETFEITKVALTAAITASDKPYDTTTDASATCALTGVLDDDIVTCTANNAAFDDENVGVDKTVTADIALAGADKDNYTVNPTDTDEATITPVDADCTVAGVTVEYDGLEHGATGSCAGIGGEDAGTLDLGAKYTNVPGGTAHWIFTGNGNYNNAEADVEIVINKAPSTVTVECAAGPFTYTGLAQTPCTATASGIAMSDIDLTGSIVYSENVNAGTATAEASWEGDTNHEGDSGSDTFEIGKATLTVTASSASVLQGALLPAITPSYDGFVNGETVSVLDTAPTCAATVVDTSVPGESPTECSGGLDNNYDFDYVDGTLEVYSLASVFNGLFKPLSTTVKNFQKNSTIPVKFALTGDSGNFFGGEATLFVRDDTIPGDWVAAASSGGSFCTGAFKHGEPCRKRRRGRHRARFWPPTCREQLQWSGDPDRERDPKNNQRRRLGRRR